MYNVNSFFMIFVYLDILEQEYFWNLNLDNYKHLVIAQNSIQ